jgi:hypothetical protein
MQPTPADLEGIHESRISMGNASNSEMQLLRNLNELDDLTNKLKDQMNRLNEH